MVKPNAKKTCKTLALKMNVKHFTYFSSLTLLALSPIFQLLHNPLSSLTHLAQATHLHWCHPPSLALPTFITASSLHKPFSYPFSSLLHSPLGSDWWAAVLVFWWLLQSHPSSCCWVCWVVRFSDHLGFWVSDQGLRVFFFWLSDLDVCMVGGGFTSEYILQWNKRSVNIIITTEF